MMNMRFFCTFALLLAMGLVPAMAVGDETPENPPTAAEGDVDVRAEATVVFEPDGKKVVRGWRIATDGGEAVVTEIKPEDVEQLRDRALQWFQAEREPDTTLLKDFEEWKELPGRPFLRRSITVEPKHYLGLALAPIPPILRAHLGLDEGVGIAVDQVAEGSPAQEAGIEQYDVLVSIDEMEIRDPASLIEAVQKAGEEERAVTLQLIHRGDRKSLTVQPKERETVANLIFEPAKPQDPAAPVVPYIVPNEARGEIDELREEIKRINEQIRKLREMMEQRAVDAVEEEEVEIVE